MLVIYKLEGALRPASGLGLCDSRLPIAFRVARKPPLPSGMHLRIVLALAPPDVDPQGPCSEVGVMTRGTSGLYVRRRVYIAISTGVHMYRENEARDWTWGLVPVLIWAIGHKLPIGQ